MGLSKKPGSATAHDSLLGRLANNAHPISAITNLIATLATVDESILNHSADITSIKQGKMEVVLNVAYLKSSTKADNGMLFRTMGYYSTNDGGNAEYKIVSETDLTPDDGLCILLNNGLYAELIIDERINFRQLGGIDLRDNNYVPIDNSSILTKYINYLSINPSAKLYIPSGIWNFNEFLLNPESGFKIYGDKCFPQNVYSLNGTIIAAYTNNQQHVWKIGGKADYTLETTGVFNFELRDVMFTTATFNNTEAVTGYNTVTKAVLYLDNAYTSIIGDIIFQYIRGTALAIRSCWEIYFGILNFRSVLGHDTPVLLFDTIQSHVATANISALEFKSLMFEAVSGDMIKFADNNASMGNRIHYINIEDSKKNTADGTTGEATEALTYTHKAIFSFEGDTTQLQIGDINIQHFGRFYQAYNSVNYITDRFFYFNTTRNVIIEVNNISLLSNSQKQSYLIYGVAGTVFSRRNRIRVNSISEQNEISTNRQTTDMNGCCVPSIEQHSFISGINKMVLTEVHPIIGAKPFYKIIYMDENVPNYIVSDSGIISNVWKMGIRRTSANALLGHIYTLNTFDFMIRFKMASGQTIKIAMTGTIGGTPGQYRELYSGTGTGNWQVVTLINPFDNETIVTVNDVSTGNYAIFDYILMLQKTRA
jgi:hypothetical protein